MAEFIGNACRRFPSAGQTEKTARIERLIRSGAWTDAALALLDLELPQWQLRRIAYDQGEWYCALSRQRELPDWLDQSIEGRMRIWRWRCSAPSWRPSVSPRPQAAPAFPP